MAVQKSRQNSKIVIKNTFLENKEMINLDLKDRKILYELDLDSRQSFRSLGKKVGLSKDMVASRIKKLQENGIIQGFYTIISPMGIGFIAIRFLINFQYTTPDKRKEI